MFTLVAVVDILKPAIVLPLYVPVPANEYLALGRYLVYGILEFA